MQDTDVAIVIRGIGWYIYTHVSRPQHHVWTVRRSLSATVFVTLQLAAATVGWYIGLLIKSDRCWYSA